MKFSVIGYLISEGFKNVLKNKKSTFSCLGVMCATMLMFGVFFAIAQNINHIVKTVEEAQGMQVFVAVDSTEQQVNHVEEQIKSIKIDDIYVINKIERVSKQKAYDTMKERMKDYPSAMDYVEVDMFKQSFIINLTDLSYSSEVKTQIEQIDGVVKITSSDQTITTLMSLGNGIKLFTLVILCVLVVVSLFIISNTIKLSVHARRKEISIMKYVGATNSFVRTPFVIEGIIIGIMSSILSLLLVGGAYNWCANKMRLSETIQTIGINILSFNELFSQIIIVYIILGVGIGIIGSTISMRKYLDV